MTTPQPAALAALQPKPAEVSDADLDEIIDRVSGAVGWSPGGWDAVAPRKLVRAILALRPAQQATPEPVGEPYGWVYTNSQGARVLHLEPSARLDADRQAAADWPNHHKCIPVYTHAPQQVPMTPGQMRTLVVECGYDHASTQERADFINGVRTGERWHRITAQAKGGQE